MSSATLAGDKLNPDQKWQPWLLGALVLLTRIPFLFDGFGHEEDSYGLVVNAYQMHETGTYFASRFPGHPVQEYLYALIWNQPAWVFNSLSCLFSIVAVIAFYSAVKNCGLNHSFLLALLFAFTTEFFIAGTYTIDYAWSLAFVMLSFWLLTKQQLPLCGIALGIAVGCRITSGVFIIPWAILLWNRMNFDQWLRDIFKVGIPLALIGLSWYIPAYLQYGTAFFDYSDQFPYPPLTKVLYKATIGVFGLLGITALLYALVQWLLRKDKSATNPPALVGPQRLSVMISVVIVLHIISYLRLPQKSGYLLAVVPFVWIGVGMYSTRKTLRVIAVLILLSSFAFSINLTDSLRGSSYSVAAMKFQVSGQEIFVDPLSGPIFSEKSKRKNKMAYVESVCVQLDTTRVPQALICGWWYNEILTEYLPGRSGRKLPGAVQLEFYAPCERMQTLSATHKIYYLPEQNLYNDLMFQQACTEELAELYPVKSK